MKDTKVSMARLALEQLSRKDRLNLVREFGLVKSEEPTQSEPRLLRRAEVARRLSVSRRTVDAWARQGILTKKRLPGRVRACGFCSQDVDRLLSTAPATAG